MKSAVGDKVSKILIKGGNLLSGTIPISGAKNSCLTLMPLCILSGKTLSLQNIPRLSDVDTMKDLLISLGVEIIHKNNEKEMILELKHENKFIAEYEIVKKMRASILVLGPLLAKFGQAVVAMPGGCAIGTRPVDLHLFGLKALGASFSIDKGYIVGRVRGRMNGAKIEFPSKSVGATANVIMAAVSAKGVTEIINVAQEPEIVDLCNCLIKMGCKIEGAGKNKILIEGVDELKDAQHKVIMDRIELGTYILAGAITNGNIKFTGGNLAPIKSFVEKLSNVGVELEEHGNFISLKRNVEKIGSIDIKTEPYPGFPTDLQAQMMALLSISNGVSTIEESIFENRFMHIPELIRMGANIKTEGRKAIIKGVKELKGVPVRATDLRASVSLVLAGLVAKGETLIEKIHHLDRGYEHLVPKLTKCGAIIERL